MTKDAAQRRSWTFYEAINIGMANQHTDTREKRESENVVDIHLHIGGKGNSSPCKMSKRFISSPAYLYMVVRSGIPLHKLLEDHDG
ncbi:MAG: hypothetical protein ACFFCW_31520, partial [Candidatus Hodarchaeota archaeon]